METPLFRREVLDEMARYLRTDDVIVLHGARQVGKTSILMILQRELLAQGEQTIYLDLEDSRLVAVLDRGVEEFLRLLQEEGLDLDTTRLTDSKVFVLIDEIQYLANPSSFMKLVADHHRYLKLIVSGSSSFEMKSKFRDSWWGGPWTSRSIRFPSASCFTSAAYLSRQVTPSRKKRRWSSRRSTPSMLCTAATPKSC